jgi:hypothetical protein
MPALILLAYCCTIIFMTRTPSFTRAELLAGKTLRACIEQRTTNPVRVLIETTDWSYVHIVVSSNHPENFIYNTGPLPNDPTEPAIDLRLPIDTALLNKQQIHFLALRTPGHTPGTSTEALLKVGQFAEWGIYEVSK